MLITLDEYADVLGSYYFTDCVVRDRTKFTFVASRYFTDEEVEQEEEQDLNPLYRDKRIIPFFPDREVGKRWSKATLRGWGPIAGGSVPGPKNQFVGIHDNHVYAIGSGESGVEDDIPDWRENGPNRGTISRLKTIGNALYICGPGRSVGRRVAKNQWFSHTQSIPDPHAVGNQRADGMTFKDIDGFSENDIYAAGGKGDVWHFDGTRWRQCAFPSNEWIQCVCCGADGNVYVSCYEGLTFMGREDRWKLIHHGGITLGFADMVWHEDRVWCTGDYGIRTIHNGVLREPDLPSEVRVCAGHMYANDGVLLVAGLGGAAFRRDGTWHSIVLRAEMEMLLQQPAK